jgi:HemY protein
MKKLIFFFLLLFLSIWVGVKIQELNGYVLIATTKHHIQASLWLAIVGTFLIFILLYFVLRSVFWIFKSPSKIKKWFLNFQRKRAEKKTLQGFYSLLEGKWKKAEKKLFKVAKKSAISIVNYLAAAYCAQQQNDFAGRDKHLVAAQLISKDTEPLVMIAQAKLQMATGQWSEALAALQYLHCFKPRHQLITKLLFQVYYQLENFDACFKLLPWVSRKKLFPKKELEQIELDVSLKCLKTSLKESQNFMRVWNHLPRKLKKAAPFIGVYASYLVKQEKSNKAERIARKFLQNNLDYVLLEQYATTIQSNITKKLHIAEDWFRRNPLDANLGLILGKICKQQKLWGKAKSYLEKSLALNPLPETYFELAQIMEEMGKETEALEYYRAGLKVKINSQP